MQMSQQGSVTGRWAHQRITGKAIALGAVYHSGSLRENLAQMDAYRHLADYDAIEKRMYLRWVHEERIRGGKRHWMKRPHDRNTNAKLRHAQAILLGWQFTPQQIGERIIRKDNGKMGAEYIQRWWAGHEHRALKRLGPFKTRHHAVVAALRDMGVEA